jgi:hypothetical protein
VRVVVVGDVAHVIVECPLTLTQLRIGHLGEGHDELFLHLVRRRGVVVSPHDHGDEADLTVGDPTELVLEVTSRDDRSLTEIAALTHFTCKMTFESFATFVPAAGASETTLVQVGVAPDPGPVVE